MSTFDNSSGHEPSMFVTKPAEIFECPLCLNVLNDPRQCHNGHSFCLGCISLALAKCEACPMCKVDLNVGSLGKCLAFGNLIGDMPTYCMCRDVNVTYRQESSEYTTVDCEFDCQWVGKFQDRQSQFVNNCLFYELPCLNSGCGLLIKRFQLTDHVNSECLFRMAICGYCDSTDKLSLHDLEVHRSVCEQTPVECAIIGCSVTVARSALDAHVQDDCLFVPMECPLVASGVCNTCSEPQPRHVLHAKHARDPWDIMKRYQLLTSKVKHFEEQAHTANVKYENAVSKVNELVEMLVSIKKDHNKLKQRIQVVETRDKAIMAARNEAMTVTEIENAPQQTTVPPSTTGHKFNKAQRKKMNRFNELLDVFDVPSTTTVEARPIFDEIRAEIRSCSSVVRSQLSNAFAERFISVDTDDERKLSLYTELFCEAFRRAPELSALNRFPASKHMTLLMQLTADDEQERKNCWASACLLVSGSVNKNVNGVYFEKDRYFLRMLTEDMKKLNETFVLVLKPTENAWQISMLQHDNSVVELYRAKANYWDACPPEDATWRSVDSLTGRETDDDSLKVAVKMTEFVTALK